MGAWRIYYADGSTFDAGDAFAAPGGGVACVVVRHPDVGRRVLHGYDWYLWHRDQWMFTSDLYSVLRKLIYEPRTTRVLPGEWMADSEWAAMYERAITDPGFPIKGGHTPDELRPVDV